MKDNSWLKLFRKIEQWEWFSDSKTFHAFIFLLLRANVKASRWNGKIIKRGQVVTSYQKIAAATGMSVSSAKRAVGNLVSTGEIKVSPTNRYNLITIVKYESYQAQYSDFEQATEQADKPSNEQSNEQTTELSTEQHHKKIEKTEKKEKSEKKKEPKKETLSSKQTLKQNKAGQERQKPKPNHDEHSSQYVPQYFEFDLKIPKQYYGKFKSADEWWKYVEKHREEVERAYEL